MLAQGEEQRLNDFLRSNNNKPLVAIFEFGTLAARVLVAPKEISENWFNASLYTSQSVLKVDRPSIAIEQIQTFISDFRAALHSSVLPHDFYAFGTAVFRDIPNGENIANEISKTLNRNIRVLSGEEEALISLLASLSAMQAHYERKISFATQDVILNIDLGGGSLEMSSIYTSKGTIDQLISIKNFGTAALQEKLFSYSKKASEISTSIETLRIYIQQRLHESISGFELKSAEVLIYGKGSSLTYLFDEKVAITKQHNVVITNTQMLNAIKISTQKIEKYGWQSLETLVKDNKYVRTQLTLICGLMVYYELLQLLQINSVRFSAYGLRYGLYLAIKNYGWDGSKVVDNAIINRINNEIL